MHQQRRVASPAASSQTNPSRTNNQREGAGPSSRGRAASEAAFPESAAAMEESSDVAMAGPSRESVKKLDQIIQVR